jgi:hypothetical protein
VRPFTSTSVLLVDKQEAPALPCVARLETAADVYRFELKVPAGTSKNQVVV